MATNQGWGRWEVNLSHTLDAGVDFGGAIAGSIISATTDNNRVDTNGGGDVLGGGGAGAPGGHVKAGVYDEPTLLTIQTRTGATLETGSAVAMETLTIAHEGFWLI